MSIHEIVIRLRRENAKRKRERMSIDVMDGPHYLDGTINGLTIAIQIMESYIEEERGRRPKLSRWQAVDLRRACQTALNNLNRGDRKRSILVLKGILEKIRIRA